MDPTIVVAIIVTIGGWIYYLLQKVVDKRYNKAKDVVEGNSATIVDMLNAMKGIKLLNEQYRVKIDEQDEHIAQQDHRLREQEAHIGQLETRIDELDGKEPNA